MFVEVKVDEDLGTLHVTSAVSAIAARQNSQSEDPLAAKFSAVSFGGWEWLQEESVIDQSYGRIMNHNLAEYHVPVNADVHNIQIVFVAEPDAIVNPIEVKGWEKFES